MNVEIASMAGFCMGVKNVVQTLENLLEKGVKVCTLGPIIHNPKVIENFKERGVLVINKASEYDFDFTMIIRSHGVTKNELRYIKDKGFKYVDGTCPFVKKIHSIVSKYSVGKKYLLIAGNENHPEVKGIRSYFTGDSFIFKNIHELKNIAKNNSKLKGSPILAVSQTTHDAADWQECSGFISKEFLNAEVFNTICNTTRLRQEEAKALSKKSDLMIVIGGKESSNTFKLYNICSQNAPTVWMEDSSEIKNINFKKYKNIGIVAGASTPSSEINKVYDKICIL